MITEVNVSGHVNSLKNIAMMIGQDLAIALTRQLGKSEIIANILAVKHAVSIPHDPNFVYAVTIVY